MQDAGLMEHSVFDDRHWKFIMHRFLRFLLFAAVFFSFLFSQNNDILKIDVKARIDSVWGPGYSAQEQLRIFDSVWTLIDQNFACFQNLDLDWNAVKTKYRPEIANGVSRGRFGAIINHLGLRLKEPHTSLFDFHVSNLTKSRPGVPLMNGSLFGAALTPLADSSLLVYRTIDQHPLALIPGDIILGYDGKPWKQLYRQLLKMELPIAGIQAGGNDVAFTHNWLQSAGANWHLFDTIDIIKYPTGDTLHLLTNPLATIDLTQNLQNATEQVPVPGIPFPNNPDHISELVRWGVVTGTNIGYVYVWSWLDFSIDAKFYNALDSLIRIHNVSGLILDFRSNNGGYVYNSEDGLEILFDSNPPEFFLAKRSNPFDHFAMSPYSGFSFYDDTTRSYKKPIAVLTGPHCISACDFISLRMKSHPNARFFGLTTSSGYASLERVFLDSGIVVQYAFLNGYENEDAPHYLTHEEFNVDEKVWHTQEAVVKGEDAVVNAALAWIKSTTDVVSEGPVTVPDKFVLEQNYPNPFNPATTIQYRLPKTTHVLIAVYDALGREVKVLVNQEQPAGIHSLTFNAAGVSSGVYFYSLRTDSFTAVKKMIVIK